VSARVVITGASGGIGGAATAALRERGARVIGLDLVADPTATCWRATCATRRPWMRRWRRRSSASAGSTC
jgi:nucleoside-diphosphate-sugar epimerase